MDNSSNSKTNNKMIFSKNIVINSNEAISWAAAAANVNFVSHYPGSPVNLIEPHLKKLNNRFDRKIEFNDSLNEHVAALSAAGASYCGARSLTIMKHVGLNIAADPFNYIGYTGVKGGMVIIVGTDPGAVSSTGEEDVHWFVPQFNFPLFEPTSVQECYDYTIEAFELSERYQIPVMIFIPGRLAYNHSSIKVSLQNNKLNKKFYFEKDREKYINVGARAVKNHRILIDKVKKISESESVNKNKFNEKSKTGIITRGLSYSVAYELIENYNLQNKIHLLNLDLVYPINQTDILKFTKGKDEIIVIEDQDGFVENQIKMHCFNDINCKIYGKSNFPAYGEISRIQVETFFINKFNLSIDSRNISLKTPEIPERLGTFCEGCPHTGSFYSIDTVFKDLDGVVGGDIGCSSLPPFRADWLLCMNAGIGISQGMAQILDDQPVISTGGDGSFFHAGALSLLSAVHNNINLIHMVFDNGTIAMTGHQESPSEKNFNHHQFLNSIGVNRVIDVSSYDPKDFIEKFNDELKRDGVRVFWVKGACVRSGNAFIESRRNILYPEIDPSKCGSCDKCYVELACPAILNLKEHPKQELKIDLDRCVRCGLCNEICPNDAISIHDMV